MPSVRTASGAIGVLALVGVGWTLTGSSDDVGAAVPAERLAAVECEIDDRGVSRPADRDGVPYDVRTHACLVDGEAAAFHFEFLSEPTIHQVGGIDDPEGGSLAVSGDGWRIHLVGQRGNDRALADQIAADTGGEVGRLLTSFVCRIRHPDAER